MLRYDQPGTQAANQKACWNGLGHRSLWELSYKGAAETIRSCRTRVFDGAPELSVRVSNHCNYARAASFMCFCATHRCYVHCMHACVCVTVCECEDVRSVRSSFHFPTVKKTVSYVLRWIRVGILDPARSLHGWTDGWTHGC